MDPGGSPGGDTRWQRKIAWASTKGKGREGSQTKGGKASYKGYKGGKKERKAKEFKLLQRQRKGEAVVLSRFSELMKNASMSDWHWIINFEILRKQVYMFHPELKQASRENHSIPWPIVWLLGRYHKGHIFICKKLCQRTKVFDQ